MVVVVVGDGDGSDDMHSDMYWISCLIDFKCDRVNGRVVSLIVFDV